MGDGGHGLDGGGARAALSALWGAPSAVGRSFVCVCGSRVCAVVCGLCVRVWCLRVRVRLESPGCLARVAVARSGAVCCVVRGGVGWAPWLELTSVAVSITVVV